MYPTKERYSDFKVGHTLDLLLEMKWQKKVLERAPACPR